MMTILNSSRQSSCSCKVRGAPHRVSQSTVICTMFYAFVNWLEEFPLRLNWRRLGYGCYHVRTLLSNWRRASIFLPLRCGTRQNVIAVCEQFLIIHGNCFLVPSRLRLPNCRSFAAVLTLKLLKRWEGHHCL